LKRKRQKVSWLAVGLEPVLFIKYRKLKVTSSFLYLLIHCIKFVKVASEPQNTHTQVTDLKEEKGREFTMLRNNIADDRKGSRIKC
jgi:hypothetical protein